MQQISAAKQIARSNLLWTNGQIYSPLALSIIAVAWICHPHALRSFYPDVALLLATLQETSKGLPRRTEMTFGPKQ